MLGDNVLPVIDEQRDLLFGIIPKGDEINLQPDTR